MEITYVLIVSIVTYVLGAITKKFINKISNKYILIQIVIIKIINDWINYYPKIYTFFVYYHLFNNFLLT